jgi:HK97 family phage major capsid protein
MSNRIDEIRARLLEISEQVQAIQDKADAGKRELSPEELKAVTELHNEFERLDEDLKRREKADAMKASLGTGTGRVSDPARPGTSEPQARSGGGLPNTNLRTREERDRWGFSNLGDFAQAVRAWGQGRQDPRLIANASLSTYSSEGVGADGGFAVPPEWRAEIQRLVTGEDSMLAMCDAMPTDSNMVIVPTDEDTAWSTSGGVRVYRRAEAAAMAQSKMALKDITVRVDEMYALVPVTDQLLEDAPLLGRFLSAKAAEKMDFKITDEVINGTGAGGQMLGIMNAPCLVTVSKESSQAADTLLGANVSKMWARMPRRARANGVWLMNQDLEPQLIGLNIPVKNVAGTENVGGLPVYIPPGGLSSTPYGTLLGRPVITTEACAAIGDLGDIIFANLKGYFAPYKAGGVREAMSIHLWFDQGVTAFKWTFRVGGQPWLSAAIARKNGSNTLSDFVTLEAR